MPPARVLPYEPTHHIPNSQRVEGGQWTHKQVEAICRQEGRPRIILRRGAIIDDVIESWKRSDQAILNYGGNHAMNSAELKKALGPHYHKIPIIDIQGEKARLRGHNSNDPSTNTNRPTRAERPTIAKMREDLKELGVGLGNRRNASPIYDVWKKTMDDLEDQEALTGTDTSCTDDEGEDEETATLSFATKSGSKKRGHKFEEPTRKRAKADENNADNVIAGEVQVQLQSSEHDNDALMGGMDEFIPNDLQLTSKATNCSANITSPVVANKMATGHKNLLPSSNLRSIKPLRLRLNLTRPKSPMVDQARSTNSEEHDADQDDTEVVAKKPENRVTATKKTKAPLATGMRRSSRQTPIIVEPQNEEDIESPEEDVTNLKYGIYAKGQTIPIFSLRNPLEDNTLRDSDPVAHRVDCFRRERAARQTSKDKGEPYAPVAKAEQKPKSMKLCLLEKRPKLRRFDKDGNLLLEMVGGKVVRRIDHPE
jgi:hypothetical protein